MYRLNIYVHQVDGPRFIINSDNATRNIHLSYHGECHYNSVRAANDPGGLPAAEVLTVGRPVGTSQSPPESSESRANRREMNSLQARIDSVRINASGPGKFRLNSPESIIAHCSYL